MGTTIVMIEKPDDREPMSNRARRYIRGIAVAMTLTLAALLFLAATLYGDNRTTAQAQPEQHHQPAASAPAGTTAGIVHTGVQ